ncbi:MAG TPA: tetratricopeptide repeat protein [Candidatus Sulfotelmatobacter sp.]|nr:tetratricopeptide repeat protein [Candidatus Sulfotelmatobacter sp.]
MIIQAILLLQFLVPAQVAEAQVAPQTAALLQSGTEAENRGDLTQAITDFTKATEVDPPSAAAFLKLGDAYMQKHDYSAAVPSLKRAAELAPDSIPVHQLLGYALLSQGYASEAIPHFEIAHDSAALGVAQLQADRPAEAIVSLKDALAKNPNDPDLIYYIGRAGAALASESSDRILTEFPETARGHQTLGQNYYASRMFPEAQKDYEQAVALRPDLPGLHLELGEIYAATAQWTKAEEEFRAEIKLQPGSAEAAYRLGGALLQQGKMGDAAEELRRSDTLRPNMPETLYALGRALSVSDPSAAERALDQVVTLETQGPLAAQAYLLLASIHRRQGKAGAASHDMQEYRQVQNLASRPRE